MESDDREIDPDADSVADEDEVVRVGVISLSDGTPGTGKVDRTDSRIEEAEVTPETAVLASWVTESGV